MSSVAEIATAMRELLTTTAERLARETGFVRRRSKMGGAAFARTTVLGWQKHPAVRLSQLVQMAAAVGHPLSPQGLDEGLLNAA
jgi:hypothetical protein